jgi:DNA-binding FadR family transcriptional regulator
MDAHELHIQLDPAKRASDDIYEQLRALITTGALKPGDRLPSERAMMAELQRSRPTIREALKRLEQGGYVTSTQGASGAVVQELSLHAAEEPLKDMIQLSQVSLSELNEYRQRRVGRQAPHRRGSGRSAPVRGGGGGLAERLRALY